MGAHSETKTIVGKSLWTAFNEAREQAEFEYGHNPYNGTIATAQGVIEVKVKLGRVDIDKFIRAAFTYTYDQAAAEKMVPARLHADLARVAHIVDNSKWGEWVAIETKYSEAKEVKARRGLAGKHGYKVWRCFGLAAS